MIVEDWSDVRCSPIPLCSADSDRRFKFIYENGNVKYYAGDVQPISGGISVKIKCKMAFRFAASVIIDQHAMVYIKNRHGHPADPISASHIAA